MSTDDNVGNKKGYPTQPPRPIAMDYAAMTAEAAFQKEKTEETLYDREMKNAQIAYENQEAKRRMSNSQQHWAAGQWQALIAREAAEARRKRLEELLGEDTYMRPDSYFTSPSRSRHPGRRY